MYRYWPGTYSTTHLRLLGHLVLTRQGLCFPPSLSPEGHRPAICPGTSGIARPCKTRQRSIGHRVVESSAKSWTAQRLATLHCTPFTSPSSPLSPYLCRHLRLRGVVPGALSLCDACLSPSSRLPRSDSRWRNRRQPRTTIRLRPWFPFPTPLLLLDLPPSLALPPHCPVRGAACGNGSVAVLDVVLPWCQLRYTHRPSG
jgi:hypothetical protein